VAQRVGAKNEMVDVLVVVGHPVRVHPVVALVGGCGGGAR
jgi:hypothetical protein